MHGGRELGAWDEKLGCWIRAKLGVLHKTYPPPRPNVVARPTPAVRADPGGGTARAEANANERQPANEDAGARSGGRPVGRQNSIDWALGAARERAAAACSQEGRVRQAGVDERARQTAVDLAAELAAYEEEEREDREAAERCRKDREFAALERFFMFEREDPTLTAE